MKKISKKNLTTFLIILFLIFLLFIIFFPFRTAPIWGVSFSQKHSEDLGLDWRKNYLDLLEDLKIKHLRVITYWDLLENKNGNYFFNDLDWQIAEAEKRDVKIILIVGMKTGRWPECHLPDWAKKINKEEQQKEVLELIEKIVLRYKGSKAIEYWQIENEPLFKEFGTCPWSDKNFLKKEVELVRRLDPGHPIILTASGEFSLWNEVGVLGDVIGFSLYKNVWVDKFNLYFSYYLPPSFYFAKKEWNKIIFKKESFCTELQAEPWCRNLIYNCSLEEQSKTIDLKRFQNNVAFAKKIGTKRVYFWGAEWWYWMKTKQNQPQFWEEAKKVFFSTN